MVVDKIESSIFLLVGAKKHCKSKLKLSFVKEIEERIEESMCLICASCFDYFICMGF